jgi:hypothetical protein
MCPLGAIANKEGSDMAMTAGEKQVLAAQLRELAASFNDFCSRFGARLRELGDEIATCEPRSPARPGAHRGRAMRLPEPRAAPRSGQ